MRRIRVTFISHIHTKVARGKIERREDRRKRRTSEEKEETRARIHKGSEDFGGLALA